MKVFVTGVAGQLGHDVMNELSKRGYEGIGSDIAPEYSGVQDGSAVAHEHKSSAIGGISGGVIITSGGNSLGGEWQQLPYQR